MRVISGALEGSNVNPTEAMVEMIANARRFEMQMKMIQAPTATSSAPTSCSRPTDLND